MLLRNINRVVAWLLLLAIVVLSVVPPSTRPTTFVPHNFEHAVIFLTTGISFGTAYPGRERLLSIGAIIFCAAIELAQLYVPGRHARLSDFIVDATAAALIRSVPDDGQKSGLSACGTAASFPEK
jgi:VanZ family protein